jgi:carbonic anhydrase/acetyltransferase-like protein (isoleucine patch superfamily)
MRVGDIFMEDRTIIFESNLKTRHIKEHSPQKSDGVKIDSYTTIIGDVTIEYGVSIGSYSSIRNEAEAGQFFIGRNCTLAGQNCLNTFYTPFIHINGPVEETPIEVDGEKYAIYLDENVKLLQGAQISGNVKIGRDSVIGQNALLYNVELGANTEIGNNSYILGLEGSLTIPDGTKIPDNLTITTQKQLENIPKNRDAQENKLSEALLEVNRLGSR